MVKLIEFVTNHRNSVLVTELKNYLDSKLNQEGWSPECMIDSTIEAVKEIAQDFNLLEVSDKLVNKEVLK